MVSKKTSWGRTLIGLLLLLNALPFSGGREIRLGAGVFFVIAGWGLLSWPVITNSFYGPVDSEDRKFGFMDVVKIAISACMLFWGLFSHGTVDGNLSVILFAIGIVILFIPLDQLRAAWRQDSSSQELKNLDELKASGIMDEEEYIKLKQKILDNSK